MGLSITVGTLNGLARSDPEGWEYHRRAFATLDRALAGEGIDWREPDTDPDGDVFYAGGFPYSYLSHLRRAFVLRLRGETVTPARTVDDSQYARDQEKVQDELCMFSSHLLCHADNGGYYVPVDMSEPLFLPEEADVAGYGMVGSSQRLQSELVQLAPGIDIHPEDDGTLSPAEQTRLADTPHTDPFELEKFAWAHLYAACRASVTSGHAIVFG
ncbi:hypothetical protein [Streptomyces stelliscabiei]|uniref:hypothetical protein n=1 Tax=Streptomyces stelliscabiei TaxID=146820 RepID=UPI00299FFC2A|nr:hypothetical protein [Streptomyces stelliscabiei]MDX3435655.1 hypothetical protein [Streptomyces stelliscabiei]MDX3622046.1 hypothetical protein [Streptomyces stelliscabiei]